MLRVAGELEGGPLDLSAEDLAGLPPEHRVWSLPNLILTPHISGASLNPHFQERTFDIFTQNVRRFIGGAPLLNELTEAQVRGG